MHTVMEMLNCTVKNNAQRSMNNVCIHTAQLQITLKMMGEAGVIAVGFVKSLTEMK